MTAPLLILPGMWDAPPRYARVSRRLEEALQRPVHTRYLLPASGIPRLDTLVPQVRAELAAMAPCDVVGFSMGALIAAAAVEPGWVRRLISVATPWQGTWSAWLWPTPGGADLRPRSRFLEALRVRLAQPRDFEFIALASRNDRIIVPWQSAVPPFADRTVVLDAGFHPAVPLRRVVTDALAQLLAG